MTQEPQPELELGAYGTPEMETRQDSPATTPSEIRDALLDESVRLSDVQLLALVLGMGTTRHGKGRVKKTWGTFELASDLLNEAGGRLEHLVSSVRRADFDFGHYGLGKTLGSRLLAAMELAHRWRHGFVRKGSLKGRRDREIELNQRVLERDDELTKRELMAVVWNRFQTGQEEALAMLAAYPKVEEGVRALATISLRRVRCDGAWAYSWSGFRNGEAACRLLAAVELARRHRARAGFEQGSLKPGSFGLRSRYLIKLLDPESPVDRPRRLRLLERARANPRMVADFARLDRMASDAGTGDHQQAIKLHAMLEALRTEHTWTHPAEVLGEPVPYRALLSVAGAEIDREASPSPRILKVQELLETAELAATRKPVGELTRALLDLEISELGLEKALGEARRLFQSGTAA